MLTDDEPSRTDTLLSVTWCVKLSRCWSISQPCLQYSTDHVVCQLSVTHCHNVI